MDYNANKYSFEELKQLLLNNNPEIREKLDEIITNIDYHYILSEKTDTANYLKELKKQGYNIYVLSDLSKESLVYNKEFDFFEFVDGGVYSFEVGSNKPNENNYKTLLNTYNLIPGETIFIDDNINNTNAANNLGIIGIQFTSLDKVKEEITNLIS
jgi:putative hydrolase of the HAD superfamily